MANRKRITLLAFGKYAMNKKERPFRESEINYDMG